MKLFHRETISGRSFNAVSYYEFLKDDSWLAIGGTEPWLNEPQPPVPSNSFVFIPDAFAVVYVHDVKLVKEDADGDISYGDYLYREVSKSDLPILVYMEVLLDPSKFSSYNVSKYRSIGLYSDVSFSTQPSKKHGEVIDISEVKDYRMMWVSNFAPIDLFKEKEVYRFMKRF